MRTPTQRAAVPDEMHPDAREFLERTADAPPLHEQSPEAARAARRQAIPDVDPEPVASVHDEIVRGDGHGVPVRVYVPEAGDAAGSLPTLVWAHGGGFVLGDLDTEDALGRALANAAGCVVVSVDYRLSPEHTFPAALRDFLAATRWAGESIASHGGDPHRLAVGGASAGGALAAGASLYVRDHGGSDVDHQVLVYPAVDRDRSYPSFEEHAGIFLAPEEMAWVGEQRFADPIHAHNPYATPALADDLSDLPPATVVTAGFDPMLDAYVAFAEDLEAAGVDVTRHHYGDMIHSFFGRLVEPEWERAREAVDAVGEDLRAALG